MAASAVSTFLNKTRVYKHVGREVYHPEKRGGGRKHLESRVMVPPLKEVSGHLPADWWLSLVPGKK